MDWGIECMDAFGACYEEHVSVAEKLYDIHLQTLRKEGRTHA